MSNLTDEKTSSLWVLGNNDMHEVEFVKNIDDKKVVVNSKRHGQISVPVNRLFNAIGLFELFGIKNNNNKDLYFLIKPIENVVSSIGPYYVLGGASYVRLTSVIDGKHYYLPRGVIKATLVKVEPFRVNKESRVIFKLCFETTEADGSKTVKCVLRFEDGSEKSGYAPVDGSFDEACVAAEKRAVESTVNSNSQDETFAKVPLNITIGTVMPKKYRVKSQDELLAESRKRFWKKFNRYVETSLKDAGLLQ